MDLKKVQEQFDKVLKYSQGVSEVNTDELFCKWKSRKAKFMDAMGGKMIYEVEEPVHFSVTTDVRQEKRRSFIEYVANEYNVEVAQFLDAQEDGIFENKVLNSWFGDDNYVIPQGMKIGKGLRLGFARTLSQDAVKDICIKLSQLVQEDKITGKLCLSVHPLDYLSISENTYNWRSCHALNGEYRAGNLSYMADYCTAIVYLKGADDVILPRFPIEVPWNSKKWRMLLFFDWENERIWAGRQYPFSAGEGALSLITETILQPLKYLLFHNTDSVPPMAYWEDSDKGYFIKNEHTYDSIDATFVDVDTQSLVKVNQLVCDAKHAMHYDDLLHSSYYKPSVMLFTDNCEKPASTRWRSILNLQKARMLVGSATKCIVCNNDYVCDSESMLCEDCALKSDAPCNFITTCSNCGCRLIQDGNDTYYTDEGVFCRRCYHDLFVQCCKCGQPILTDEAYVDDDSEDYYCANCWQNIRYNDDSYMSFGFLSSPTDAGIPF